MDADTQCLEEVDAFIGWLETEIEPIEEQICELRWNFAISGDEKFQPQIVEKEMQLHSIYVFIPGGLDQGPVSEKHFKSQADIVELTMGMGTAFDGSAHDSSSYGDAFELGDHLWDQALGKGRIDKLFHRDPGLDKDGSPLRIKPKDFVEVFRRQRPCLFFIFS